MENITKKQRQQFVLLRPTAMLKLDFHKKKKMAQKVLQKLWPKW